MAADSADADSGPSVDDEDAQSIVPITRAFRGSSGVAYSTDDDTDDVDAVAGAIRVQPAAMSMVDDLGPAISGLAGALSLSKAQQGAFVGVQRSVDYEARRDRYRRLADRLEDREDWPGMMQADLAAERAAVANLYQETSTRREHYLVISVTREEAAASVSDVESSLSSVPVVGKRLNKRRVGKLADDGRLLRMMVEILDKRVRDLAEKVDLIDGVTATPISSAEYIRVIADYYRADDVYAMQNFDALVHQSPVPERGDPEHETSVPDGPLLVSDDDTRENALKSLCAPRVLGEERDGALPVGQGRRTATLSVTNWPDRPPKGFLEPLYQYSRPGVEVTITTHWERIPDKKAKQDAKGQVNNLETQQEGKLGEFAEEYVSRKKAEAEQFRDALEVNRHGVFDAGLFVTVSAPADSVGEDTPDVLRSAIEDLMVTIKEDCGFDATVLNYRHEDGWQTTSPLPTNEIGTNVTVRGRGLARQFPYQYRNIQESGGVQMGTHDFLSEPTVVNIFDRPNGFNGGLYGTIGSGKTTSMQYLADGLIQSHRARDEPFKAVISTPLQDFESVCEIHGGEQVVVGGDTGVNPLDIHYIPPRKLKKVGKKAPWKDMVERFDGFLETYYHQEGLHDYGTKSSTWKQAAKHAQRENGIRPGEPESYKNDAATLRDVIGVLEEMVHSPETFVRDALADDADSHDSLSETARTILQNDIEAFATDGKFANFAGESTLDVSEADLIYLDLQRYESDEEAGGLMMQMLLSDIYEQLKAFEGRAFMGVDEFHYMLANPRSAQFFKRTHRHSRHWDLGVWLATQEFGDLFVTNDDGEVGLSDSAKVIFNNQPMQLYHKTKEMDHEWADTLGLSNRSFQYIKNAESGGSVDYANAVLVVDDDEYPLQVEMSTDMNPRSFAMYEHDPTEHAPLREFLREYRDSDGVDPCDWRWA